MKPIIILPPESMSAEDVKVLRDNGLCAVVAKNPAAVKFLDPIPSSDQRSKVDHAAIKLSRVLLHGRWGHITNSSQIGIEEFARLFVQCLEEGTCLDERGTISEQEESCFTNAKREELQRLAREEARVERVAKKAAAAAAQAKLDTAKKT